MQSPDEINNLMDFVTGVCYKTLSSLKVLCARDAIRNPPLRTLIHSSSQERMPCHLGLQALRFTNKGPHGFLQTASAVLPKSASEIHCA